MSWLSMRLGYGKYGTVDVEHPTDAPHVTVEGPGGTGAPPSVQINNQPGVWSYYSGVSGTANVSVNVDIMGMLTAPQIIFTR